MQYIQGTTDIHLKNSCVTIGKFDGLHRGHQALLKLLEEYERQGYNSVMLSFDVLPKNLLKKTAVEQIYSDDEKRKLLEKRGPQVVISYPFTIETSHIDAQSFISDILIKKLDTKVIVIGEDFCFGRNREGNASLLEQFSAEYGYKVVVCKKIKIDGNIVSSTRIREELKKGNREYAQYLLGREYFDKESLI